MYFVMRHFATYLLEVSKVKEIDVYHYVILDLFYVFFHCLYFVLTHGVGKPEDQSNVYFDDMTASKA